MNFSYATTGRIPGEEDQAKKTGLFYQRDYYPLGGSQMSKDSDWQDYIEFAQTGNYQQRLFSALRDGRRYTTWYITLKDPKLVQHFGYIVLADMEQAITPGEFVDAARLPNLRLGETYKVPFVKDNPTLLIKDYGDPTCTNVIIKTFRKVELGGPYQVFALKLVEVEGLGQYDIEIEEAPAARPGPYDIEVAENERD